MSKFFPLATLAVALAASMVLAKAQQSDLSQPLVMQHIASAGMTSADRSAVESRSKELTLAARIYGYSLEAGNWTYEQTLCSPMQDTIMLHYSQNFPDGTESLFTALVPRGSGRVHIVPVLYHSATPFLPAPKNPRNYALFNELVSRNIADGSSTTNRQWIELGACYAELTGVPIHLPTDSNVGIGIAGAPSATIHLDPLDKSTRVTFANREGERIYKVWNISFNQAGRITAADAEDSSVIESRSVVAEKSMQPGETSAPELPATNKSEPSNVQLPQVKQQPTVTAAIGKPNPKFAVAPAPPAAQSSASSTASTTPAIAAAAATPPTQPSTLSENAGEPERAAESASEPGWKYTLHPAEPASKLLPQAPPPPEKVTPEPPDPIASPDQSQ